MHSTQRRRLAAGIALAALSGAWGCANDAPRAQDQADDGHTESHSRAAATPVRTVTRPADDCGWIPAAEVEQIVGPLAGPPSSTGDGCVYPLVKDSATLAREQQARALKEKLEQAFGPSTLPNQEPQEPAVIIHVNENVDLNSARAASAALDRFAKEALGPAAKHARTNPDSQVQPAPEPGADRPGHLWVQVSSEGFQVSREQKAQLAARVRERIPDLPFAYEGAPGGTPVAGTPPGRDPCGLLTASEAEAVLGKLMVPPYRAHEDTPLAQAGGKSCAYFTAGHRALVLTPTWEYGGILVDAIQGVGGIMSGVVQSQDEAADTLDGPWDEAGGDPTTGSLYFLKGERVLVVHHLGSSTDYEGAVRLAGIAMERLGDGAAERRAAAKRGAGGSPCPAPDGLGTAAGFELTFTQAFGVSHPWMTCMYELTGRYRGTFLKFTVQPASHADRVFAQVQRTAKTLKGQDAGADRVALGDGGWAYGSGGRSQAVALVRGRLYGAELDHIGLGGIGDQKDAMVRVLEAASR